MHPDNKEEKATHIQLWSRNEQLVDIHKYARDNTRVSTFTTNIYIVGDRSL